MVQTFGSSLGGIKGGWNILVTCSVRWLMLQAYLLIPRLVRKSIEVEVIVHEFTLILIEIQYDLWEIPKRNWKKSGSSNVC